ncbi:hypothetical protein ACNKHX_05585 [Shigella flexneri]
MKKIQSLHTYRGAPDPVCADHHLATWCTVRRPDTPDGRRAGAPFGLGATRCTVVTRRCRSVPDFRCGLPFAYAKDGISYTFSIVPNALGKDDEVRIRTLLVRRMVTSTTSID